MFPAKLSFLYFCLGKMGNLDYCRCERNFGASLKRWKRFCLTGLTTLLQRATLWSCSAIKSEPRPFVSALWHKSKSTVWGAACIELILQSTSYILQLLTVSIGVARQSQELTPPPATKLTQHKERGPVTCVRTAVTYFERCSNVARLTSHKRLATTLDCT